jgi:ribose-phosphate pyrophosphokinase
MIVFSFPDYKAAGYGFLQSTDSTVGEFDLGSYENGELHCEVLVDVEGQDCAIVTSIRVGHELEPLLLAHTLKRLGAKKIELVAPYIGYMRQDKEEPRRSLGAAWIGTLIKASGIDSVLTVDLHSDMALMRLSMPVESVSSSKVFAQAISDFLDNTVTILAPDDGALNIAHALEESISQTLPVVYFDKIRTEKGVTITPTAKISGKVVLIDDILDSGRTMVAACKLLKEMGVTQIVVCATHALFTGNLWRELFDLNVSKIYVGDSIPNSPADERIQVVPLSPLFQYQRL